MIKHLNEVNDVKVYSVYDDEFKEYGRIVEGYDFKEIIEIMNKTDIPSVGNVYIPSVKELEDTDIKARIENEIFGGMAIQIGYCNGRNSTYNGFEYHKSSELNIAVSDFMLVFGKRSLIKNNTYDIKDASVFYVPKGLCIEMYQTTLHLSPCKVSDEGFRCVVILPKGTNTPLKNKPLNREGENQILLHTNKWVISHKDREPLIKQGAYPGLIGENKELKY